jgi:hypothetical protein
MATEKKGHGYRLGIVGNCCCLACIDDREARMAERMKMGIKSTNSCKPLWRQSHDQYLKQ